MARPCFLPLCLLLLLPLALAKPKEYTAEEIYKVVNAIYDRSHSQAMAGLSWLQHPNQAPSYNTSRVHYGNGVLLWDVYGPFYTCISKQHLGRHGDGGKYVCGISTWLQDKGGCTVYSIGSRGEDSFERDVTGLTPCSVYVFDPTVSRELADRVGSGKRVKFHSIGLGDSDGTRYLRDFGREEVKELGLLKFNTLASMMDSLDHTWIDILKVDIEGGEWEVFPALLDSFDVLPFTQLLIEIHVTPGGGSATQAIALLERLTSKGFRVFSTDPNLVAYNSRGDQHFIEYSLVQVDDRGRIVTGPGEGDREWL